METLAELISFILNMLLVFIGIYIVMIIMRVYSLYRSLGFSRTVLTPFLLVGALFAFSGLTELFEDFLGNVGLVIHSLNMLATAVFLVFGLSSYHKMLAKAEESKGLPKTN